ncbi:dihydroneopterin aldolase [Nocardioides kongjuensis]|uniref:7,8-dihydroneopterin aldolase n=1 Tax=Nocardioides kongjuensis TaxID=349522 RepID=A0A852RVR1_9ACTN|nr:dihydroneopterin aldolase [Nocardioides kongjuensis]NYD32960.1 dihydroneopterin aldolase [Nocardioides kongjuensis]
MTDELSILGIECFAHHGVFDHERRDGQVFRIDLTLAVDTAPAAASDDLRDTVDYGSLVDQVVAAVTRDPVDLIETLAQRIADTCLLDPRVEWVRVTVHKPDAPIKATFADVQLTITRRREAAVVGDRTGKAEGPA